MTVLVHTSFHTCDDISVTNNRLKLLSQKVCIIKFFYKLIICMREKWNHLLVPIYISLSTQKLNISQQILQWLHAYRFIWYSAAVFPTLNKLPSALEQQFSTGGLQVFLKCAIPVNLVRHTDLLSPRLSNKNMTTVNTTKLSCGNESKLCLFLSDQQKIYCLVYGRTLVISLCVPWHEKGWKSLL